MPKEWHSPGTDKGFSYSEILRLFVPEYEELHSGVVEVLLSQQSDQSSILVLGSGEGEDAERILDRIVDSNVVCVDNSEEMLDKTAKRLKRFSGRYRLINADLLNYEPEGSYDSIVSVLTLHHFDLGGKRRLYGHLIRHLKGEGVFVVGDLFTYSQPKLNERVLKEYERYIQSHPQLDDSLRQRALKGHNIRNINSLSSELDILKSIGYNFSEVLYRQSRVALLYAMKNIQSLPD
ncbi:MAG: class I SAM-dependent methyltransferase [Nanoarchaeota archaeon]|nr:class I SAM-dependent methyltransferase [Nanoarchaeota archaeon]MBU1946131.1 class I SAM-dependent methyltransferase [Nanoarchaeota archaeon]